MNEFGDLLPPRSIEDILAERIRITVGGEVYDLPVLNIASNRLWRTRMDLELGKLVMSLDATDDTDKVLALFSESEAMFLDLLTSYDFNHVLPPPDQIEAGMTPLGLVRACLEVWRAARPLADIAAAGIELTPEALTDESPGHTSGWRQRITGLLGTSNAN